MRVMGYWVNKSVIEESVSVSGWLVFEMSTMRKHDDTTLSERR